MYERLLDEATHVVWADSEKEGEQRHPQWESLAQQFAQSPTDALPILLKALRVSDVYRKTAVVLLIDALGYPANEPAIPLLLWLIGGHDPNSGVWIAAFQTLEHLGPVVVIPHLIRAFLEKGEPYHQVYSGRTHTSWQEDIEGLSMMLCGTRLPREWACQCCPIINFLLAQTNQDETFALNVIDSLLAVVEKAGNEVVYLLPTLIALAGNYTGSDVGRHARDLVFSFSQEALAAYVYMLAPLSKKERAEKELD